MAPEDWNDDDVRARAKVTEHVFVVCPVRNMDVPVTLEIHDSEPPLNTAEWDHVVLASIRVPSGKLEVHECTGSSQAVLSVEPGTYRIRAHYKGLESLSENGLKGCDAYKIVVWRDIATPLTVIKNHPERVPERVH